jgi:O-antigen ligase
MLQLIYAYVAGLGPYIAVALVLGFSIPFVLLVTRPARWLVAFSVLFMALVPFGGSNLTDMAEGSSFRQIGWGAAFLVALFFALRDSEGKFTVPWIWLPVPYMLLLAYALLSVTWSEQPLVSAKRAVQLLGVLFIAFALIRHRRVGSSAFGQFAWPGLFFLLLGVLALASHSLSIDPDGNYKGFTVTKNVWGQFALLMALVFMFQALNKTRPRLNWGLFVLASVSLFATRSATTILIYFMAISVVLLRSASMRYGRKLQIVGLAGAMAGLVLAFGYFMVQGELPLNTLLDAGFGSIGKNATLTGRTALWQMMGYEIARHPWLGTGYGGFWLGLEGPSYTIVRHFSWRPGQAHNGYIEVTNELGYVGLALLLVLLGNHLRNIYRLYKQGDGLMTVFHLSILASAMLLNVSESSFMRTTHLWWIILTISIIEAHVYVRLCKPGKR